MSYQVQIQEVAPQTTAIVHGQANSKNIGEKIVASITEVRAFLAATGVGQRGLNVALYHPGANGMDFFSEVGLPIEAGVIVEAAFEDAGCVACSTLPGGRVATAAHTGDYQKLPEAHAAIHRWCAENGHELAGDNWEVYGHWSDNPEEVRTDVFYLLK